MTSLYIHKGNKKDIEGLVNDRDCINLGLCECSLTSLDDIDLKTFAEHLQILVLSGNLLQTIKPSWFVGFVQLTTLDLSGNQITVIDDPTVFKELPKLENINLCRNEITRLHRGLFREMIFLKTLDLSDNRLQVFDEGLFRDLVRLEQINLSGNGIQRLNMVKVFSKTRSLAKIDLSNNQLDDESVNEAEFRQLEQLQCTLVELNLSGNRLTSLAFVRNLIELERLDVSKNEIESINDGEMGLDLLGRLVKLRSLDLSHNQIKNVTDEVLDRLTRLFDTLDYFRIETSDYYITRV